MPAIWTQRADYTSEELPEVTPHEALNMLWTTDWRALLDQKNALMESGDDFCDPGFGIVLTEGEILHLIEPSSEPYNGFYHYQTQHKKFGLFRFSKDHTVTFNGLTHSELNHILSNWSPFDPEATVSRLKLVK